MVDRATGQPFFRCSCRPIRTRFDFSSVLGKDFERPGAGWLET